MPNATDRAAARCPYGRQYSRITEQYSIIVGYAELTAILGQVDALWDFMETHFTMTETAGNQFAALMEHVDGLRQWTGWDGVPRKYLTEVTP